MGYIPSDAQSLRSQATYSSGLPSFAASGSFGPGGPRGGGGGKRGTFGSYASSIISQDAGPASSYAETASVAGSAVAPGTRAGSFAQSDRLRRRGSVSSWAGTSELGSASAYDYKSTDDAGEFDDVKSQYTSAQSQAGVTVF